MELYRQAVSGTHQYSPVIRWGGRKYYGSTGVDRRAEIAILITALSDRNKVIQQQRDALKNKVSTSEIYCEGCALSIAIQTGFHSGGSNE